ncbi:hypothetical protein RvY_04679 [Ramazzottius varieornatus]|uniref:Uncharacterized protein n=1 Tax=Ramazzottius varieornatus TaxID=947166 RepID=A0A1D1USG9_RAMVA|nr:hypothetical protein RvY_04679 [Ramazzottius varieornatus]
MLLNSKSSSTWEQRNIRNRMAIQNLEARNGAAFDELYTKAFERKGSQIRTLVSRPTVYWSESFDEN